MARAQPKTAPKSGSDTSFASLNPTLLARKGGAKPAMRPQLAPIPDVAPVGTDPLEDLGWNDMGEAAPETSSARPKKAKAKPTKRAKPAKKPARRAAFTLRLDTDRHLKLRLAATMHGISAQALVTEAIDAMFDEIEDLDALASRMKRN